MNRWCDRVVLGGVLILLLGTPLAFGSVHPWAFSFLEIVIFLLATVWAVRTRSEQSFPPPLHLLLTPLVLLVGLVLWQLCPLPPSVLRTISPATHTLYSHVLPGWPQQVRYNEPLTTSPRSEESAAWVVLPTPSEVTPPTPPRADTLPTNSEVAQATAPTLVHTWRSLSPAPMLTRTALLKLMAYVTLFALIVGYPFAHTEAGHQRDPEARFLRAVILTILFSGGVVALLGIVQCFSWNGKLLWFFVPYDWSGAQAVTTLRAQGPFVNYSHFANYLAVIFPLTLTATVFPLTLVPVHVARAFRLLWGSVSFFIGVGIFLSNSRGGWMGLLLGGGIVLWGLAAQRTTGTATGRWAPRVRLLSLAVAVVLAFAFIGVSARQQMDRRLDDTLQGEVSGLTRVMLWMDTAKLMRDFPVWGVGLGAWSTVFPHYQRPLLGGNYFREAHNDYVELVAETGVVGLGLLAWFFVLLVRHVRRGLLAATVPVRPLFIALGAAISVMALHETVDFNLQIPAIAVLFTVLLGLAVRLAQREIREKEGTIVSGAHSARPASVGFAPPVWEGGWWEQRRHGALVMGVGGGACALIVSVLQQEQLPYPYNLPSPTSLSEVRAAIHAFPTHVPFHLAFARLVPHDAPVVLRQSALEAALWLAPGHAQARDLYAVTLFRQGKKKEGLEQTSLSVFHTPEGGAHIYLRPRLVPWLPPEEQAAIEEGLRWALVEGRGSARTTLGQFYAALGRFREQAVIYEEAARTESRAQEKASWLLQASQAYQRIKDAQKAEQVLRAAVALTPSDLQAYQQLVNHLAATRPNLEAAKGAIAEGIGNGLDAFELWLGLAAAAQSQRDIAAAKDALSRALTLRPESPEAHMRLGHLYLQERNFDRAALIWRKVTDLDPSAASGFYHLGVAERGRYRFFEAEKAFVRALALQPNDATFQREYTVLRELMEKRVSRGEDRGPETDDRRPPIHPVFYSLGHPKNLRSSFPTDY